MKQDKKQQLSEKEMEKAAGGKVITRRRLDVPSDDPDEPTPQVDDVTPLPDPDFGISPGGGMSKA